MKEVYEVTEYVRVNGEEDWHCVTFWRYLEYGEMPQTKMLIITDFEEARQSFEADTTFLETSHF